MARKSAPTDKINSVIAEFNLLDWLWPMIWDKDEPITLHFSDGTPITFHKGERVIFPKQLEFLESMFVYDATLFGGAKSGGKTRTMVRLIAIYLMLLAKEGHPKANAAIFSETYKAAWDRHGAEILKGLHYPEWMGEFNQQHMVFRAHDEYGGWTVEYRNTTDFEEAEKSTQYAIIGIDESTNQQEAFFSHIGTCMRWTTRGVPVDHCPILLATNPVGLGLGWHIDRFIKMEPRRDGPRYDKVHGVWRMGHHFIQSLPTDNPANSKKYLSELMSKPPKIRDAYYFGLWNVFEGQFFDLDERVHSVRPFVTPYEWSYTLSLDYGLRHTACALVSATDFNGTTYFIDSVSCVNTTARQMKELMRAQFVFKAGPNKGKPYPFYLQVADHALFKNDGTTEGDKLPIEIWNSPTRDDNGNVVFSGFQFMPAEKFRKPGWQALAEGFHYQYEESENEFGRLIRTPKSLPGIRIFSTLTELWSSLTLLQHSDRDPDDAVQTTGVYEPGQGDDEAIAAAYNVLACRKGVMGAISVDSNSVRRENNPRLTPSYTDNPFGEASIWA